jgi:hypothetical protein
MKIAFDAPALVVLLIGAQSCFAQLRDPHSKNPQGAYQSGYKWVSCASNYNCHLNSKYPLKSKCFIESVLNSVIYARKLWYVSSSVRASSTSLRLYA